MKSNWKKIKFLLSFGGGSSRIESNHTYSWSRIFLGKLSKGPLGKIVLDNISFRSEFLCFSSPSLPPEAKWPHTKQKLVSCI